MEARMLFSLNGISVSFCRSEKCKNSSFIHCSIIWKRPTKTTMIQGERSNSTPLSWRNSTVRVPTFSSAHWEKLWMPHSARTRWKMFVLFCSDDQWRLSFVLAPSTVDLSATHRKCLHPFFFSLKIFFNNRVIDYLRENFIVWPWNVTSEYNADR